MRPLVRLSVTVIAEQTVDGQVRASPARGGGGGAAYGYFQDGVIESYVDAAVNAALTNLGARAPAGEMSRGAGPGWPGVLLHEAVGHGPRRRLQPQGLERVSGRVGSASRQRA